MKKILNLQHEALYSQIMEENHKLLMDYFSDIKRNQGIEAIMQQYTNPCYFDKMGRPISHIEWKILQENESYKVIKRETVFNNLISTMWIGTSHEKKPKIFQTMVLNNQSTLYCKLYATLEEALKGHEIAKDYVRDMVDGKTIQ